MSTNDYSQQKEFVVPEQVVIAYTAGILDGEGSIQINPCRGGKDRKIDYWGLTVQISSCCFDVLNWMRTQWGGLGTITEWQHKKGKQKSYNWRLYSFQSGHFLKHVLPYMIIKKEVAKLAIEFRNYVTPNHAKGMIKKRITPELSAKRTALALAVRDLNRRYGKGVIRNHNPNTV